MQGCSIGCPGCLSRDTWAADDGRSVTVEALLGELVRLCPDPDGITISGGEPFEQADVLGTLLTGLAVHFPHADILCYSGLPVRRLQRDFPHLLAQLDALVPEPFLDRRPDGGPWRGSDNQPLVLLTARARARYERQDALPALQVAESDGVFYVVGVPLRGDLARLDAELAASGVRLEGRSWT